LQVALWFWLTSCCLCQFCLNSVFFGGIASWSASDFAYSYSFLRSVVCLSVCLAVFCLSEPLWLVAIMIMSVMLQPFNGLRCRLAKVHVGSKETLRSCYPYHAREKERVGGQTLQPNLCVNVKHFCFVIMCTCILPGKAVPEMTYTVSGGTLNPTHSLTPCSQIMVGRVATLRIARLLPD